MGQEFSYRTRLEERAAMAEGRPQKSVKYSVPPVYYPETGVIEYPGYSNETIRKVKLDNENI